MIYLQNHTGAPPVCFYAGKHPEPAESSIANRFGRDWQCVAICLCLWIRLQIFANLHQSVWERLQSQSESDGSAPRRPRVWKWCPEVHRGTCLSWSPQLQYMQLVAEYEEKGKKIYLSMHSAAVMFQPGRRSRAVKMLRISRFLNLVCTGLYNTQSVCHKSQFTCVWACAVKPASFSITCQLSSWQLWKIIIRWTKSCLAWANCSPSIHVTAAVSAGRGGCLKIISGLYPLKHGAIFYARKTKICLEMWQRQVGRGAKDVTRSRTCSIVSSWQTPSLWATPASLWKCWIWTEVQRDVFSGASHKNDALRSHTSKYNSRGQKLKTFPDDLLQQSNPRTLKQP